ncbi:MAG: hypothetical protein WCI57_00455 [Candidatus Berkelbacteria bacterium]
MKANILIEPILPVMSLFAAGRELVALIDLKEIQDELYRGTERQIKKCDLGQVYIAFDHDAMNKMVAGYQRYVGFAYLTYYRSEWADPNFFTKEKVEDLFGWQIPFELKKIYWNIIRSHREDYYIENREITHDRIVQLEARARQNCLSCKADLGLQYHQDLKAFLHPGWNGHEYSWHTPVTCDQTPIRIRQAALKVQYEKLLAKQG